MNKVKSFFYTGRPIALADDHYESFIPRCPNNGQPRIPTEYGIPYLRTYNPQPATKQAEKSNQT